MTPRMLENLCTIVYNSVVYDEKYGSVTIITGVIILYFIVDDGKWLTFYLGPLTSHNFSH
jgi:hypothetical protein